MKFRAPKQKQYQQATDGIHPAVIADVEFLGEVKTKYGIKPKVRVVYLLGDELDEKQMPVQVSQFLVDSLHHKSTLFAVIVEVTGKEPDEDFDSEDLIGLQCRVKTKRFTNQKGQNYAGVNAVYEPNGEAEVRIPLDFIRAEERKRMKAGR